jgi:spore photoproduct lyase
MIPMFDKILIHPDAANAELTRRILDNLPGVPTESADEAAFERHAAGMTLTRGKRILYLTIGRGSLVKPCPGTSDPYLCCGYTVVNQQTHCPMDCTYCILQNYLEHPVITVHVNTEEIFRQIGTLLESQPDRFFRIGTGELTDSLALDPITKFSRDLLAFFGSKRSAILELKTKTDNVRNLLAQPVRRAVVSWSVNPQRVIQAEEHLSAGLDRRLSAAKECAEAGFLIGFHFDPILCSDGWEKDYDGLIDRLFSAVESSRVAWISLGSLRFPPALKDVIGARFPGSRIQYGEMIRGLDGKMRYAKPVRIELYRRIHARIRERAPDTFVYFCMESPDVWERMNGKAPASNEELDRWFTESLKKRFPELQIMG